MTSPRLTLEEMKAWEPAPVEDLVLFGERWMARAAGAMRALAQFYRAVFQDPAMAARWDMAHSRAERAIHAEYRASGCQAHGRHVVAVGRRWADRELAEALAGGEGGHEAIEARWIGEALAFSYAMREGYQECFRIPDAPRVRLWLQAITQGTVAARSVMDTEADRLNELASQVARAWVAAELDRALETVRGLAAA